jgi:hypothetical protein
MLPEHITAHDLYTVIKCLQAVHTVIPVRESGAVDFSKADYMRILPALAASGIVFVYSYMFLPLRVNYLGKRRPG